MLLQYALPPLFDECVEFRIELSHAIAEFVEAEVDAGELVGHGGGHGRHRRPAAEARGEGRFECGDHTDFNLMVGSICLDFVDGRRD